MLLRPTEMPADLLIGQSIQLGGYLVQLGAVLYLNRSFGLLPAHRGVKSDGLYRFVRHPLYSAYLLAHTGYLINNYSIYNLTIVAVALGFQVVRILQEEELLIQYQPYAQYASRTRWRLLPAIW